SWERTHQQLFDKFDDRLFRFSGRETVLFSYQRNGVLRDSLKNILDRASMLDLNKISERASDFPFVGDFFGSPQFQSLIKSPNLKSLVDSLDEKSVLVILKVGSEKEPGRLQKGAILEVADKELAKEKMLDLSMEYGFRFYDDSSEKQGDTDEANFLFSALQGKYIFISESQDALSRLQHPFEEKFRDFSFLAFNEKDKKKLTSFFYCRTDVLSRIAQQRINELLFLDDDDEVVQLQELSNLLFFMKITGILDTYVLNILRVLESVKELIYLEEMNKDFTLLRDFVIIMETGSSTD
ncbi:MAG: hypothetical protein JW928_04940, partial [Candidatus Aureabacteria bacterium]|nr:hypothetical protein [Candidatus Auribacterota bacterium]